MTTEDMEAGSCDGPASHTYVSQRLKLHYVDWGNHGAPVVVLIHGGRDHARSWDDVARGLRDQWHVVAVDLRGHGDSDWSPDGAYTAPYMVTDLAQLIDRFGPAPVSIVAHSLGGSLSLRYAGIFPEHVRRIAAIEGVGLNDEDARKPAVERWRTFVKQRAASSARSHRRYATLDEAVARMKANNVHLSDARARHLTTHAVVRNADGTFSWKFDPFSVADYPDDISNEERKALWRRIDCPVWLVHGADSWAKHPGKDGRADIFAKAHVTSFERAGHWVHHDRLDAFVAELRAFLA
ncbi:alpha/beta hydrolase [Sphingobium sp. AN641]|uniref:alpha/beta fold hydrolase n=1 Tax=Sphingobium sp. AN641 TaxID=3133443 RepID=UPI0030C275F9